MIFGVVVVKAQHDKIRELQRINAKHSCSADYSDEMVKLITRMEGKE